MRRTVATLLATVVALVVVPASPAHAVDLVIDHLSEIPAPYSLQWKKCDGSESPTSWVRLEPGPSRPPLPEDPGDHPPLGTGSLELDTPVASDAAGIQRDVPQLSDLVTFDLWTHDPDARGEAVIRVLVSDGSFGRVWTARTALGGGSTWGHVDDLMTRSWTWTTPPTFFDPEPLPIDATIGDFAAQKNGPATVTVQRQRCGGAEPVGSTTHIDALTITAAGEFARTFDFEEPPVDLLISADPPTISVGGTSRIAGEVYTDDEPLAGATVRLMRSTNGTDFTAVTTVTADQSGFFFANVSPATTTHYRWDFDSSLDYAPASSARVTVVVKQPTALSSTADRTSLVVGDPVSLGATLTSGGTPVGSQPVVLRESTDGGATWTDAATATTGVFDGHVQVTRQPSVTTQYRWHFLGSTYHEPTQSGSRTVTVRQRTAVTANVSPGTVDYGESGNVVGLLTVAGAPAPGQPVELWTSVDGVAFSRLLTATTGSDGRLSQPVAPTQTRYYQWRYQGSSANGTATSPTVTLTVRRQTTLTMAATPISLVRGQSTTFSTVLRSAGAPVSGASVLLDVSTDGGTTWTRLVTRFTDSGGAASYVYSPAGSALYRWRFERTTVNSRAVSATQQVTVTNTTGLTIRTDTHSVLAGGTATLGTTLTSTFGSDVTPLPGRTVALMASTDGGQTWVDVGTSVTDANGSASLAASPAVETTYRWRFDASGDYRSSRSPTTRVTIAQPPQETSTGIDVIIEDGNDDQIYDGQTVTFRGTLTADGAPKYNRTLLLEASTDGGATWTQVSSQATNINGQVTVTRSPRVTARYRWRFAGAGSFLLPSTSPERTLTVTPRTATALTASAVATTIDSGERAQLKVLLTAGGQALPGAEVTLQRSVPGTGEWNDILSATTGPDGRAALSIAQEENTAYRWAYAGSVSRLPASSAGVVVQSRFVVRVTSVVPPASAPGRLRVLGRVTPYTGAPVRLMRPGGISGAFEVARATLRTDGTFTIFATLENAGSYTFFVEVGPDLQNAKGRTPSFTVVVPAP